MITFIFNLIAALWVIKDARERHMELIEYGIWGVLSLLLAPVILPAYLSMRPLMQGEKREGGVIWNICRHFLWLWSIYCFLMMTAGVFSFPFVDSIIFWPLAWGGGCFVTLIIGLFARDDASVEVGPTGTEAVREVEERVTHLRTATEDLESLRKENAWLLAEGYGSISDMYARRVLIRQSFDTRYDGVKEWSINVYPDQSLIFWTSHALDRNHGIMVRVDDHYVLRPRFLNAKSAVMAPQEAQELIRQMRHGSTIAVMFHTINRRQVELVLPLEGFRDLLDQLCDTHETSHVA